MSEQTSNRLISIFFWVGMGVLVYFVSFGVYLGTHLAHGQLPETGPNAPLRYAVVLGHGPFHAHWHEFYKPLWMIWPLPTID